MVTCFFNALNKAEATAYMSVCHICEDCELVYRLLYMAFIFHLLLGCCNRLILAADDAFDLNLSPFPDMYS